MYSKRLEIALYGKGGIGKSTISANLSAALAASGRKVLQIGCDPKHDSTRLLLGGRKIPTVLDYLRDTPKELASTENVLIEGYLGIGCIEAGGPKPGVGCAGRGIISAFEFLERNKTKERYDTVVYDVLGDVVCGGFAVPIRREYAGAIFLVTSGEFMALYAANNILRGIRNYDSNEVRRVAGIIYNDRSLSAESGRVERFARAVGLPICARFPRSEAFSAAEEKNCTVAQLGGFDEIRTAFEELASRINGDMALYEAMPLSDEELEDCVLRGVSFRTPELAPEASAVSPDHSASPAAIESCSTPPIRTRQPLYGCAFNGAAAAAIHLTDSIVIAHSPRSCAFYTWQTISSPGRKNLFNRGIIMPSAISPNFECTQIDHAEAVFGGMDKLREHVRYALERKPGAVIVISSCVSGIIGDDVLSLEDMSPEGTPVIVIPADGVINGDYMEGIRMCLHRIALRLIDRNAETRPKTVNIIGEMGLSNNSDVNYRTVKNMLERMGISIGCRFLGDATSAEVSGLLSAPLNILASGDEDNVSLMNWLKSEYGCEFFEERLPIGFKATRDFLFKLGRHFSCEEAALPVIEEAERVLKEETESLRPVLQGKKILLTTINANLDWILEAAKFCGMEFVWIGVLNYLHRELSITDDPSTAGVIEEIDDWPVVMDRIEQFSPDIVLSNYTSSVPKGSYIVDNMPMTQQVGFYSGLETLKRWALLSLQKTEGNWINDKEYFEKYYS